MEELRYIYEEEEQNRRDQYVPGCPSLTDSEVNRKVDMMTTNYKLMLILMLMLIN